MTELTSIIQIRKKLVGGGGVEVPYFVETDRFLTYNEAADILKQDIKDSITIEPPY